MQNERSATRLVDGLKREQCRRLMLLLHHRFEASEEVRTFGGDIAGLGRIAFEVVELGANGLRAFGELLANGFPIAGAHGLLATISREFAVEEWPSGLLFAEQGRSEADAVDASEAISRAAEFEQRG